MYFIEMQISKVIRLHFNETTTDILQLCKTVTHTEHLTSLALHNKWKLPWQPKILPCIFKCPQLKSTDIKSTWTGITYKLSPNLLASNLWPGPVPPSLSTLSPSFTRYYIQLFSTTPHPCCPLTGVAHSYEFCSLFRNILPLVCWQTASYLPYEIS